MAPAIRVEGLSKMYRIGSRPKGEYSTLRETIAHALGAPLRILNGRSSSTYDNFWALKDVSFQVEPGEVVGVIGRNGAGKSTLLKILSRITEPTSGRAVLRGRVASLLEVGTGFHPELTGRENIYLNGSILGMSNREIAHRFDQVVDFAGIEQFLDTPVKRYSSGMYVRLAFAIAAHLEPEILIIDEVLAVGDVEFQKKCLGKMQAVSRAGRTVLFVSHNMAAVEALCSRVLEFDRGRLILEGETEKVLFHYHSRTLGGAETDHNPFRSLRYVANATLIDAAGIPTPYIPLGSPFRLKISFSTHHKIVRPLIGIGIDTLSGQRLLTVHTPISGGSIETLVGSQEILCTIPAFPLATGDYRIKIALTEGLQELEAVEGALKFTVVNSDAFGEGRGFHRGICVAASEWRELETKTSETQSLC